MWAEGEENSFIKNKRRERRNQCSLSSAFGLAFTRIKQCCKRCELICVRLKGKGLAKAYAHRSCLLLRFSWSVLHQKRSTAIYL